MGESEVLSAYNEIGSSDFAQVIKYSWLWDREERDQWERYFFFKYFQIFNFDLAWKTLRIIPMTESVNRASPTQKRGKKRFVVINTKKINIFFNTNHCHEATHLTAFLFQKKNMSRNIMPEKASSALGLPMPSSNTAGRMVHPLDGANFIKAQEQEDMKLALKSQVI